MSWIHILHTHPATDLSISRFIRSFCRTLRTSLQFAFNSWLNEAAIDAIVTLRSLPSTDAPSPPSSASAHSPDHRHQGPHLDSYQQYPSSSSAFECATAAAAAAAASQSHSDTHHVYLGAGFSSASLATVTDAFVASLHALAPTTRVVLIVCVGGHHWVLLCWQRGAPLRLLDPMCSTAIDSTILLLAARLANDVGAFALISTAHLASLVSLSQSARHSASALHLTSSSRFHPLLRLYPPLPPQYRRRPVSRAECRRRAIAARAPSVAAKLRSAGAGAGAASIFWGTVNV